jgi:hypothetical protein
MPVRSDDSDLHVDSYFLYIALSLRQGISSLPAESLLKPYFRAILQLH